MLLEAPPEAVYAEAPPPVHCREDELADEAGDPLEDLDEQLLGGNRATFSLNGT